MANRPPIPPPGFDELSVEEQIDYVQGLWDYIAASVDQLPLHDWQRRLLDDRLAEHRANPQAARPWQEALAEIENRLRKP